MGTKDDSIFNAGDLDENDFIVMEPPNVLFELDDSYFYAGQVSLKINNSLDLVLLIEISLILINSPILIEKHNSITFTKF